ncbi:MAG TPA: hypothetical protein VGJ09_00515 [Bryobacteraceae bacterium]
MGDAYHLDCSFCDVQIEISKKAYATRCDDPEAVLESIREKMAWSKRPRIDLMHMKTREETNLMATKQPEPDVLTTAAQAIGSTLGKLAVKTGIAKPAAAPQPVAVAKKSVKKAAAKKKAPSAKKAAPKKSIKKAARGG